MGKKDVPVWKNRTPKNFPDLQLEWERLYHDLHTVQGIKKSTALEMIGQQYGGLSRQTIMYWIFPDYKKNQNESPVRKWSYEKENPEIRKRITEYKQRYMDLRLHIDEYIEKAYQLTSYGGSMTLEELSRNIELESGISLAPKTILGLNDRYEAKHGEPLIIENDENPAEYLLNLDDSEYLI